MLVILYSVSLHFVQYLALVYGELSSSRPVYWTVSSGGLVSYNDLGRIWN